MFVCQCLLLFISIFMSARERERERERERDRERETERDRERERERERERLTDWLPDWLIALLQLKDDGFRPWPNLIKKKKSSLLVYFINKHIHIIMTASWECIKLTVQTEYQSKFKENTTSNNICNNNNSNNKTAEEDDRSKSNGNGTEIKNTKFHIPRQKTKIDREA